jgi:putative phosphoribosyl transferase
MEKAYRVFVDRREAGIELARAVAKRKLRAPMLVLGLPRGGVPVAYEVAKALRAPLDVMIVRKIGMPGQPELAIGAIASGNVIVRERHTLSYLADRGVIFEQLVERERAEVERRERSYRAGLPPLDLKGQNAILVDDGLATGSTMLAAVRASRQAGAASVVVAAPVASREAHALVSAEADDVIILQTPEFLYAIGEWYSRFDQLEDAEVHSLLEAARKAPPVASPEHPAAP